MREKHLARRTVSNLFKAQKSCRKLDEKKDFSKPAEKWFWPASEKPARSRNKDSEEVEEEVEEGPFYTNRNAATVGDIFESRTSLLHILWDQV